MRFSSRCAAFVRTCSYSSTASPCCCSALTGLPLLGRVRRGRTFLVDINLRYLVICTFGFGLTVLFSRRQCNDGVRSLLSFVHPFVHPSIRPSVCPSVRPSVRPSIHQFIHSFIHTHSLTR